MDQYETDKRSVRDELGALRAPAEGELVSGASRTTPRTRRFVNLGRATVNG